MMGDKKALQAGTSQVAPCVFISWLLHVLGPFYTF
jgi:hypothetical protein